MTTELEGTATVPSPDSRQPVSRRSPAWWRGLREILLIIALWLCYSAGRNLADQDEDQARARAKAIFDLEKAFHIDIEHALNHGVFHVTWLAVLMCFWYASLHYLVTPLVLVWVYVRRRDDYARMRNALVIACGVALVCYIFLPTMPPRLMPPSYDYIDTLAKTSQYGWWSGDTSAPKGMGGLTNELAAMPSLHVGWTIWVAWVARRLGHPKVRFLAYFYAFGTTAVVLCTANHWVLDVVAGIALVLASIWVVDRVEPLRRDDGFVRLFWAVGRRLRRGRSRAPQASDR